jgi:hypothetical protein
LTRTSTPSDTVRRDYLCWLHASASGVESEVGPIASSVAFFGGTVSIPRLLLGRQEKADYSLVKNTEGSQACVLSHFRPEVQTARYFTQDVQIASYNRSTYVHSSVNDNISGSTHISFASIGYATGEETGGTLLKPADLTISSELFESLSVPFPTNRHALLVTSGLAPESCSTPSPS